MLNIKFTTDSPFRLLLSGFFVTIFICIATLRSASAQDEEALVGTNIVVLGDSLAAGYQLPPGESYPEKLQLALNDKEIAAKITGAGVSGDTSSGGLSRLAWSVPDGTNAVILELGANDALRGLPPTKTEENLETMITRLLERDIRVLLIGMLAPPNMGEEYAAAFNPIYQRLSDKYEIPLYPFFLDGVMAEPGMTLEDGMHPNEKGVDVMVAKTLPLIEALIEDMRPAP